MVPCGKRLVFTRNSYEDGVEEPTGGLHPPFSLPDPRVISNEIDLRKHFTFRRNLEHVRTQDIKPGDVRDLHQLLLTGIAHTDRHLAQIKRIKQHQNFPK